ncbi:TIM44-like domain-containing protein [Oxalobacteraceae bacterium R-40]|uniref:TIM44-like domain-containing protein n=1 Tax=Keguizhuia sedimenti TaxID=3064264 RepID=A0ABU1BKA2_9BURK|nr:TIM44-like domain-containing protein [Oxalobacteraceae bacterium R-40]
MKRILMTVLLAFMAVSVGISTAEAKRMGGGGSFGKQSQSFSRQATPAQSSQATNAARQNPAQGVPPKASPWKGILGGALLGLGLGALLSHLGLSGAMASFISTVLMIALLAFAVMFIIRMLRRKSADNNGPRPAYANGGANSGSAGFTPRIGSGLENQPSALQGAPFSSGFDASNQAASVPADFDAAGFLRHAKTYFIRLQAAWDRADVNDIREFTTPEMFAELKMQLQERGASPNHTDVMSLDADLLGIETIGNEYLASVKFSGMIKESENASAEPFTEIWNLSKPVSGQGGWILAGIQQMS